MFEVIDQQLQNWVGDTLGDVPISLAPPPQNEGINLYLLSLGEAPPMRTRVRTPLQAALHYLVTCWHDTPSEAHAQLSRLLFSAIEHPDYDVLYENIGHHLWQTFGIAPQPAFILRVIAYQARPEPDVPRVQRPRVETVPAVPLFGQVFGPNDIPIVGAYVQLPILQVSQRTDMQGKFYFPNVPGESVQMLVRAKGVERRLTVSREKPEAVAVRFETF